MPPAKKPSNIAPKPPKKTSLSKTSASVAAADAGTSAPTSEAPSRRTKRRMDTRLRLMSAALALMSDRGVDGVTIQDITNAADVGFGSFYNHFPSKDAVFNALKEELIEHYAAALDQLGEQLTDPAEKIAASARYTIRHSRHDPVWGKFVLATSFNRESLQSGLGKYLLRDIQSGIAANRFRCHHLPSLVLSVGSTILGGVMAEAQPPLDGVDPFGSLEDMPEYVSATVLMTLGLDWQEAKELASRPLPIVKLPVNPFRGSP